MGSTNSKVDPLKQQLDEKLIQVIEGKGSDDSMVSYDYRDVIPLLEKGADYSVVDMNGVCTTFHDENSNLEARSRELFNKYHGFQRYAFCCVKTDYGNLKPGMR